MSDTPDRFGTFNGGTGPIRPSCGLPLPHVGVARVSDQETTSNSAASEFSDLFDWDAYTRDHGTDATSQSDVPSEGKSPSSPPAGTASSTAVTTPGGEEDYPMSDAPPQEPQNLLWPIVPDALPPRDLDIHLETSPSPLPSTDMHLEPPSHAAPAPSQKKRRIVKSPEETGRVRQIHACYLCRRNKAQCDPSTICPACKKRPFSESVCIRTPLRDILLSKMNRWNWNDPSFFMPGREQFNENRATTLSICCSEDIDSPCMKLEARPFALPNEAAQRGHHDARWGIVPNNRPSEQAVLEWMEQQIDSDRRTDFEAQMDKLLLSLARRPESDMLPSWTLLRPLLLNVRRMRCMWKIWSCDKLFVRDQLESRVCFVPFDPRFASIQDSLRLLAAQSISELERKILPEIQKFSLPDKKQPEETNVLKWLLLWQMILIYRQSLSWILTQEQPIPLSVMPLSSNRHDFRENTRALFEAIIVIFSGVFQKDTTVEKIRNAGPEILGDDRLHSVYQSVWQALPNFYDQVSRQVSPTDRLFEEYIVKRGTAFLAKSRPARKL